MTDNAERNPAARPEDLSRLFVERANAGDVDGLVALYEPDAVLAFPPGQVTAGSPAIRQAYERLLADRPTRLVGSGATVEVARRQPDGTWLWAIDQPNVLG
jgi:hypothetical protein